MKEKARNTVKLPRLDFDTSKSFESPSPKKHLPFSYQELFYSQEKPSG